MVGDGAQYNLFPGIPCSVRGYYTTPWHVNTGYFFPSVDYAHPDLKPLRLSGGVISWGDPPEVAYEDRIGDDGKFNNGFIYYSVGVEYFDRYVLSCRLSVRRWW